MEIVEMDMYDWIYYDGSGDTITLVRIIFQFTDPSEIPLMDKDDKNPNWLFRKSDGYYGYTDNNGDEFRVIFVS